jgi:hypothetical protein
MSIINEYSKQEQKTRAAIKAICDEIRSPGCDPELSLLGSTIEQTKHVPNIVDGHALNLSPAYMITELFWLFVESREPELARAIMADRVKALRTIEAIAIRLRDQQRAEAGEFQGHA